RRVWNELLCLSAVRNVQRVGGQQVDEWLFLCCIPFGISHQPLLELRKDAFSLTGGAARIESIQWKGQAKPNRQSQREQQHHTRTRQSPRGEDEVIGNQDENERQGER